MYKLAVAAVSALLVAGTLTGQTSAQPSPAVVSVLYAASLVTPMQGPIADALRAKGVDLQGEPGGSKKLANFIASGVRSPDAFICVDPATLLKIGSNVASATTFARTSLGIAWSSKSRYADLLAQVAAGRVPILKALATPGVRIGRTDPQLDPKGVYTVRAIAEMAGAQTERHLLGEDENPLQIFPEEDLLSRVETGEIDVGFFYRTEALARNYRFVALPSEPATQISYVLAVMKNAPHPQAAQTFASFILKGGGRAILERAGLDYISPRGNP